MVSKIESRQKEIAFLSSILPITRLILETATIDPHARKNPEVLQHKAWYRKGVNYGFANAKTYVLDRDGHACRHCKGKSNSSTTRDKRLEVHYLVFRSNGGSDDALNVTTRCKTDHDAVHKGLVTLKGARKKVN